MVLGASLLTMRRRLFRVPVDTLLSEVITGENEHLRRKAAKSRAFLRLLSKMLK